MFAVFVEVNDDGTQMDAARKELSEKAAPGAQGMGAIAAYWLAAQNGRGVAVIVFQTEDEAKALASLIKVGEPDLFVPGVTFRTVEIREVLAHL